MQTKFARWTIYSYGGKIAGHAVVQEGTSLFAIRDRLIGMGWDNGITLGMSPEKPTAGEEYWPEPTEA